MNEEIDARGARIFQDLNNAFKKDPQIDEYGIIPVLEAECNRSPVVLTHHKLGLESWAVPVLYEYAYQQLFHCWNQLVENKKIQLSQAVLLINAECYTVWNIRKNLVLSGAIASSNELKLTALVLRKHPKSAETFSHRKWLLKRLHNTTPGGASGNGDVSHNFQDLVNDELEACSKAADKHPSNYYAWSHRIWVVQNYAKDDADFLLKELKNSEHWVWTHISDHSGFHYRQFLLQLIKNSPSHNAIDFLSQELELTSKMVSIYPDHEAMWYHRRFVIFTMLEELGKSSTSDQSKKTKLEITADSILSNERELAARYTDRPSKNHQKWLNRVSLGNVQKTD